MVLDSVGHPSVVLQISTLLDFAFLKCTAFFRLSSAIIDITAPILNH